ncbi:MAG: ATP-binding protein [Patescibacteria group bacterium]|jgi:hypothetical protein
MENIAEKFFNSFTKMEDIEKLISEGETEGQYLECKSPQGPYFDKGLKSQLAKELSAFANAGGGVILFGVSTTKHKHSETDVLSQIEEVGAVKKFRKELDVITTTLIEPSIISCRSKVIFRNPSDSRGVVVTFVPPTPGDPIRSNLDREFYIRIGDDSSKMPYETVKKMFAGTAGPELSALFNDRLVKLEGDGSWKIPIILSNESSAAAKDTEVSVTVINGSACETISGEIFKDQSNVNPGSKVFMTDIDKPIFRGKNVVVGYIVVKMKKAKFYKRNLNLKIDIFASNMRAKTYTITIKLAKKGFSVMKTKSEYLY